jgi:hypothetical protein
LNGQVDVYELSIYSRWGSAVFKTSDYLESWNGSNVADGVYYYGIRFKNCKKEWVEYKGLVQLIR